MVASEAPVTSLGCNTTFLLPFKQEHNNTGHKEVLGVMTTDQGILAGERQRLEGKFTDQLLSAADATGLMSEDDVAWCESLSCQAPDGRLCVSWAPDSQGGASVTLLGPGAEVRDGYRPSSMLGR
ncbi:hypothetical protein NDU88_006850 [Pleurodeles waltl]|uniref:Uncharacterized protein n=1 Tax=Pleurodeles waltl TaxID=8319 RepID=A0AAV7PJK7_PLEWA|nr:hypothetical protein NDU88_006850 [Pleurodeles waltl]